MRAAASSDLNRFASLTIAAAPSALRITMECSLASQFPVTSRFATA